MAETIISRLLEASRIHADRIALSFRPGFRFERWTYRQLWSDVGAMSAMLRSAGLQPGDRVLIWAPSCPQWAVAFFGTLKAGGMSCPWISGFLGRLCKPYAKRPNLATRSCHRSLQITRLSRMLSAFTSRIF